MLLDNVYRALSPKGAFFFTLNKTFNLIKSDYFFLPQPVDLKKKKKKASFSGTKARLWPGMCIAEIACDQ